MESVEGMRWEEADFEPAGRGEGQNHSAGAAGSEDDLLLTGWNAGYSTDLLAEGRSAMMTPDSAVAEAEMNGCLRDGAVNVVLRCPGAVSCEQSVEIVTVALHPAFEPPKPRAEELHSTLARFGFILSRRAIYSAEQTCSGSACLMSC